MNKPLDQLSKAELIALLGERDQRIEKLEGILAKFQKMLFGQKRERFESPDQIRHLVIMVKQSQGDNEDYITNISNNHNTNAHFSF